MNYPGKYPRSHPLGDCFYNTDKKLCYVQIPKNASSSIRKALGWHRSNFITEDLDIDRYIVVLRDPAERWLSATNYFCKRHRRPRPDEHYESQNYFIGFLDFDKVDFFWYSDNILQDIDVHYGLGIDTTVKVNGSAGHISLNNDDFIRVMYKDDYDLISSVRFIHK